MRATTMIMTLALAAFGCDDADDGAGGALDMGGAGAAHIEGAAGTVIGVVAAKGRQGQRHDHRRRAHRVPFVRVWCDWCK